MGRAKPLLLSQLEGGSQHLKRSPLSDADLGRLPQAFCTKPHQGYLKPHFPNLPVQALRESIKMQVSGPLPRLAESSFLSRGPGKVPLSPLTCTPHTLPPKAPTPPLTRCWPVTAADDS